MSWLPPHGCEASWRKMGCRTTLTEGWKTRVLVEAGIFWTCTWTYLSLSLSLSHSHTHTHTRAHSGANFHSAGGCFSPLRELERGILWKSQEPDQPALLSFPLCLYSCVLLTLAGGVCLLCVFVCVCVCVSVRERVCKADTGQ